MRYLLDTHVLLWLYGKYSILPNHVLNIIKDPKNELLISSVSVWEIAIKKGLQKLDINITIDELYDLIEDSSIKIINIEKTHLKIYADLIFYHRDPFDRMLVAISNAENITIITHDKKIHQYDVNWLW